MRLELGGEHDAVAARGMHVERLDAERIAGQREAPVRSSWIANANMPRKRAQRAGPPRAPGLEHDLGVGVSSERAPGASSSRRSSR